MSVMHFCMGFLKKRFTWPSHRDMLILPSPSMYASFTKLFMVLNKLLELGLRDLLLNYCTLAFVLLLQMVISSF